MCHGYSNMQAEEYVKQTAKRECKVSCFTDSLASFTHAHAQFKVLVMKKHNVYFQQNYTIQYNVIGTLISNNTK